ncbi:MAG TPA: hypothetical protein VMU21_11105 [Thermodesulfovibrionales bacterium]|nr:hypothetical protein [Thermodesulfovibrionales bacterium]
MKIAPCVKIPCGLAAGFFILTDILKAFIHTVLEYGSDAFIS